MRDGEDEVAVMEDVEGDDAVDEALQYLWSSMFNVLQSVVENG